MPAIDDPLPDEADEALELAPIEAPEEDEEDEETKEARAQERLNALGITLRDLFADYEQDRLAIEERWMQDLRQYNGVYDPVGMSMSCIRAENVLVFGRVMLRNSSLPSAARIWLMSSGS